MKKIIFLAMLCLMAISICVVVSCTKNENETNEAKYVDLGLSSGTKWKDANEKNAADVEYAFFNYDEAVAQFDSVLPSREQWEELVNECNWTWTGMGYKIVGPNGNSISLPAAGYRSCPGSVYTVGSCGFYWSSSPNGSHNAWYLNFESDSVYMDKGNRCGGYSVRLVQD